MSDGVTGPAAGARMTEDYLRSVGKVAYLWAWPLVNLHNRLSIMEKLPGPGLLGGVVPAAPPGSAAMLHDYVTPEERLVACPNQDVVYGFGIIDAQRGPSVVQVPDFGGRFWVYQAVNQRTDSFVRLGAMYGTEPGLYLLAPPSWDDQVPDGIAGVFRFDTRIAVCIPPGVHGRHRLGPGRDPAGHQPDHDVPAERVHRPGAHHRLDRRTEFPGWRRHLR